MADDRIEIAIELDDGSVRKGFARIESDAKATSSSISSSFAGIGTTLAAAFAAVASVSFAKKVISEAISAEESITKLNNSLKLAGTFSESASQQFQSFASEMQRVTTFSDDQVLSIATLARNYARTNDEALKLTKTALDFAEATGTDAESAVRKLGGTLSGELGAGLSKIAPELKGFTAEQIKAGAAVDLLNSKFSGAAQANAQTFGAKITQLQNAFGDLFEELGGIATKSPELNGLLTGFTSVVTTITQKIITFAPVAIQSLGTLIQAFLAFGQAFSLVVLAPIEILINTVRAAFDGVVLVIQGALTAIVNAASALVNAFAPDSSIGKALSTFAESTSLVFTDATNAAGLAVDNIFSTENAGKAAVFFSDLADSASRGAAAISGFKNRAGADLKDIADTGKKASFDINTALGAGIARTVQSAVASIQRGENAFRAFGKAVLGVFGDLAIQLGTFFIINGFAVEALKSLGGAAAVAAGIALVAFGTLIKGFSGGDASAVPASTPPPVGGPTVSDPSGSVADPSGAVQARQEQRVVVNVQGDILDSKESGLRIVELLNDAFNSQGARVLAT